MFCLLTCLLPNNNVQSIYYRCLWIEISLNYHPLRRSRFFHLNCYGKNIFKNSIIVRLGSGGAFTAQVMMGQQLGLNSFERWTQIRVTIRPDVVSHVTQDLNASTTYLMRRPLPKPFSMDLDAVSSGIHRLSSLLYNYAFKIFSVGICKENSVERILKKTYLFTYFTHYLSYAVWRTT